MYESYVRAVLGSLAVGHSSQQMLVRGNADESAHERGPPLRINGVVVDGERSE